MDTGYQEIRLITTEFNGYDIECFGPLSDRNGGPWACRVFKDGLLIDAIYGLKNQKQAFDAGKQSVREELKKEEV